MLLFPQIRDTLYAEVLPYLNYSHLRLTDYMMCLILDVVELKFIENLQKEKHYLFRNATPDLCFLPFFYYLTPFPHCCLNYKWATYIVSGGGPRRNTVPWLTRGQYFMAIVVLRRRHLI